MILVPTGRLAAVFARGAAALLPGTARAELLPLGLADNLLVIALCLADLCRLMTTRLDDQARLAHAISAAL